MTLPFIDAAHLNRLLPMTAAIDALDEMFGAEALPASPARQHLDVAGGELLLMPASGDMGTGVKLITVASANPGRGLPLIQGVYVLFSPERLEPIALLDGAALTRIRTAAVSGVATRHLARKDASRLVVFGAGVQGKAHVEAMRAVREIANVTVVDREGANPGVVESADIICTCTTSATPVFDGALLAPGVHVNAIGAYRPTTRELDDVAISAGRVVVETRAASLVEAGDLIDPLKSGVISKDRVEELAEVVKGDRRRTDDEITVFKSVGLASEDLAVARAAFDRLDR